MAKVYPSLVRFHKIQNLITMLVKWARLTIAQCLVNWPPGFMYRNHPMGKVLYQVPPGLSPEGMESFTRTHARSGTASELGAHLSLQWCAIPQKIPKCLPSCIPDPQALTTDASLTGSGALNSARCREPQGKEP